MLLSVFIITYNHERYIAEAICGAISQITDFPYEVVICDDSSTDGTSDVCLSYQAKYPNVIRYFKNSNNIGPVKNFINGLSKCQGDYVAICEGDDYWQDNFKCKKQIGFLISNPQYGLIHSDADVLLNGKLIKNFYRKHNLNSNVNNYIPENILTHDYSIFTCTTCFKKDLANHYLTDNNYNNYLMADTPLWYEISKRSKIHYMEESTSVRRLSRGSLSYSKEKKKTLEFLINGFECSKYIMEKWQVDAETCRKIYINFYNPILINAFHSRDKNTFNHFYMEMLRKFNHYGLALDHRIFFFRFSFKNVFLWSLSYIVDLFYRIGRKVYRKLAKRY